MFLKYWFKIQPENVYVFKWEGKDLFSDMRNHIVGRLIVLEEHGGKEVLRKNDLLNGKVYIIFRKPNNVKYLIWKEVLDESYDNLGLNLAGSGDKHLVDMWKMKKRQCTQSTQCTLC